MDNMRWLQQWYHNKCDGVWGHFYGVKIYNIDNPGWVIEIEMDDYKGNNTELSEINYDNGGDDWIMCAYDRGKFIGRGGSLKLDEIIGIFRRYFTN